MDEHEVLGHLLTEDRWRLGVLRLVCDLDLPDGFITGGFVRNMVWDHLHARPMTPLNNVDVIYFDPARPEPSIDVQIAQELTARSPKKNWVVVNVARWSPPPPTIEHAVGRGPETATAVAVAVDHRDNLSVIAPHGLSDLFDGVVRPTTPDLIEHVRARSEQKRWSKLYPQLRFET